MQAGSSDASMSSWRVFATDMKVRPDDLDFFQHVHASRYQDYVLAARFDQMERCYGLSMQTFLEKGLGWYVKEFHIHYKRSLGLGDAFVVRTWVEALKLRSAEVCFEILKHPQQTLCCQGRSSYTLIDLETGRPQALPPWVKEVFAPRVQ